MTGQLFPTLTPAQLELVQAPLAGHTFLEGPAGCGKTTVGVERLVHLLENGVPGESILVFVPQRALGAPYYGALRTPGLVAGGMSDVLTIGGLARRMVELFWPLVAGPAGFVKPDLPPTFLTLETAQYYMAHLVRPLLEQGYFDTVVIERNRLYSQILDNLNKAAMVGFSHTAIGERLKSAWVGELAQLMVYENAQDCANLFRSYCLEHNLLDFSLQIEIFNRLLWPQRWFQAHLAARYRHLIADNLEENPPVAHDLLRKWLADFDSALLIFDNDAGYRFFFGRRS
jgi:superfamily I DNA/RNA helicase